VTDIQLLAAGAFMYLIFAGVVFAEWYLNKRRE
jgi:hypothetical protein